MIDFNYLLINIKRYAFFSFQEGNTLLHLYLEKPKVYIYIFANAGVPVNIQNTVSSKVFKVHCSLVKTYNSCTDKPLLFLHQIVIVFKVPTLKVWLMRVQFSCSLNFENNHKKITLQGKG